jgi:integrase
MAKYLLNDTQVKAAKPQEKAYKLSDGEGLYLLVTTAGKRLWRLRYTHGGKENMVSVGRYPATSLEKARKNADGYRAQLADNITPAAVKRTERRAQVSTFKAVAMDWLAKQPLAAITRAKAEWIFGMLYPFIGNIAVAKLEPPEILEALERIERRGKIETAHRAKQRVSQVMRYAVAKGLAKSDPARDLRGALKPLEVTHHASVKDPDKIGALLRAIDGYEGQPTTHAALKLAPLLFVRPGELRAAEWSEFDLDAKEPEWRIPGPRMKMGLEHIVPLSKQAVAILRELHPLTGPNADFPQASRGKYVFPSVRSAARPLSDNTLNAALRRLGYTSEEMTAHGFRSMASTQLNEQGFNSDHIERQLAHVEGNNVRKAYNAAEYLPQRRRMMQRWAAYLDGLKAELQIAPIIEAA